VVDEQLRAPVEELRQGLGAFVGPKDVLLIDRHPRQLAPLPHEFVPAARQLLLALQQCLARLQPFLTSAHFVLGHRFASLVIDFSEFIVSGVDGSAQVVGTASAIVPIS
jgi:hypothetical protein